MILVLKYTTPDLIPLAKGQLPITVLVASFLPPWLPSAGWSMGPIK